MTRGWRGARVRCGSGNTATGRSTKIDPDTGAILRTIESNRFVTGVTWVDDELWHGTWEGDDADIRQVDPETGEVLTRLTMPEGTGVSGLDRTRATSSTPAVARAAGSAPCESHAAGRALVAAAASQRSASDGHGAGQLMQTGRGGGARSRRWWTISRGVAGVAAAMACTGDDGPGGRPASFAARGRSRWVE